MSHPLISRNPDLLRLQTEGYTVSIVNSHLVISDVPYVGRDREVRLGSLVSDLTLAGDVTQPPANHVAYFVGDMPCSATGEPLTKLVLEGQPAYQVSGELTAAFWFSSKPTPPARYEDYYDKMTTYVAAVSGHAEVVDPTVTARNFKMVESANLEVFEYHDTASSRAGISATTEKLSIGPVAIIGLGGTGAYILDLIAKTPVAEIHLFDGDTFLQHNAFRSPGAVSKSTLSAQPKKSDHYAAIYAAMRSGIISHPIRVEESNVTQLDDMAFVFLAIDDGPAKRPIIDHLEDRNIAFIDVGMGVYLQDNQVGGILRTTLSSPRPGSREAARTRISVGDAGPGEYNTNIQIAELNSLNAALAVIRFKKTLGFYSDLDDEHFNAFVIDSNVLINEDGPPNGH